MKLVLVRHGIAVERNGMRTRAGGDDARPLTKEGRKKVRRAARALKRLGPRADAIVHSGLVRARETAEPLKDELRPRRKELLVTETLRGEADPRAFVAWLGRQRARVLVAVGHAPHLDRLIARLGNATRPFTSLGKAGAACFELAGPGRRGGAGSAELEWLLTPKQLRQVGD